MKKLCCTTAWAVCFLLLASCGNGSGQETVVVKITVFEPDVVYSHQESAIRVLGEGFGSFNTTAILRFTAESGTPFEGGTAASVEIEVNVDNNVQVRGTLDPTFILEAFNAYITVIKADGTETTSATPDAHFEPQEVTGITPSSISSGAFVEFEVSGNGFQPPEALVEVFFVAETGTPFLGGGADRVSTTGIVTTSSTIRGIFPDAQAADTTNAFVVVGLPTGEISSATPLIQFLPTPSVVNFNPAVAVSGLNVPFTVNGTAFSPIGGTATVTLVSTGGTEFANGISGTHVFSGTIQSAVSIQGTMPDPMVNVSTFARVRVDLPGGGGAESATPLVEVLPAPTIDAITPNQIECGEDTYNFTITGTNLPPVGQFVDLTIDADVGTPFNQGAAGQILVQGTISAVDQIGFTIDNPDVDAQATVTITADFQNGGQAISPTGFLTIDPEPPFAPPVWDPVFGSNVGGGASSDDGSNSITFTGGFTFDFWGVNYSSCFVGSNGFITFGSGDSDLSESEGEMQTDQPRIAGYWDDLRPTGSQVPKWKQLADRAVITFDRVPEYFSTGQKSFQFTLWDSGRIDIYYLSMSGSTEDGLMGITPGNSLKAPMSYDFSATVHDSWTDVPTANFPYERWFSGGPDLDPNGWIVFEPLGPSSDGSDGYRFTTGP